MTEDTPHTEAFAERRRLLEWLAGQGAADLRTIARRLTGCFRAGGKVLVCGNGGSASQAEHFAAELAGRFKLDRDALPVLALSCNTSALTAIANDYGFSEVFARQVRGFACAGDCLVVMTTSGKSENIVRACAAARERDVAVIALTGAGGLASVAKIRDLFAVPDDDTARIQEAHLTALHLICEFVETDLFSPRPTDSRRA